MDKQLPGNREVEEGGEEGRGGQGRAGEGAWRTFREVTGKATVRCTTGLDGRVSECAWMCINHPACICVYVSVCVYQCVCVCVFAHGSVPGSAIWLLDRALLINSEVNCCGSTRAVSNITLGTGTQQTTDMFVYDKMCVCLENGN